MVTYRVFIILKPAIIISRIHSAARLQTSHSIANYFVRICSFTKFSVSAFHKSDLTVVDWNLVNYARLSNRFLLASASE